MSKTYSDASIMDSCDESESVRSGSSKKNGINRRTKLNTDENKLELMKEVLNKKYRRSKSKNRNSSGSSQKSILNKAFSFGVEEELEYDNNVNNNNVSDDLINVQIDQISPSAKQNAFQLLMSRSKCSDQDTTLDTNVKQRKKYKRKPKYLSYEEVDLGGNGTNSVESNKDKRILLAKEVEDSDENIVKLIPKQAVKHCIVENDLNKKRKIEEELDVKILENAKKQKRRVIKNAPEAVETSDNKNQETIINILSPENMGNAISWSSGRPKRSCSAKVTDYSTLVSPEKQTSPTPPLPCDTPKRRGYRSKKKIVVEECVLNVIVNDSEDEEKDNEKLNVVETKVTLAPLFMKKVLKPAVDPKDIKARRNFLLSGIPDEMRFEINKKQQFEEQILLNVDLIAFPLIAHVTQLKSNNLISNDYLWSKSKVKIKPIEVTDEICSNVAIKWKFGVLTNCNINADVQIKCNKIEAIKSRALDDVKLILGQLKVENKNFPFIRCYKQLLKMKNIASKSVGLSDCTLISSNNAPFVEIYKPKLFNDYVFGLKHMSVLQQWLDEWNEKHEIEFSDSDSDFGGSRHSIATKGGNNNNYIVLFGEQSTGKSSSVYALANDLNYKVIEINAGSKRTGKKLLQDLQEATQSHRINKNKIFSSNEEQKSCSQDTNAEKTLILIEDADIVFEDIDDGFVSSLQQLINISKRPVIMTSNSRNCQHLVKYIQNNSIHYNQTNSKAITDYLRTMCLVEHFNIKTAHIGNLFALNDYDLRRTIVELEFFIKSHNASSAKDTIDKNSLFEFYTINRRKSQRHVLNNARIKYNSTMNLDALQFHSDTASKLMQICNKKPTDVNSYQQHCLTDEIANYLEQIDILQLNDDFSRKEKPISSISNNLICQSFNMSQRALHLDPLLRDMCRSEEIRFRTQQRKGSKRYHYLSNIITNSNDYFSNQAKIFEN
ncbi:unnamed protein product [Diamesa serratosioi]